MDAARDTEPVRLEDCVVFAEEIAARAGSRALARFRRPVEVELKGDASPVTIADREAEEVLRAAISGRFPDHAIFGEEFGRSEGTSACTWVVDPIDGTRSFITGWPIWGTLVALLRGDEAQLGVIEMPALGERWSAMRGGGAWFAGTRAAAAPRERCAVSACQTLAEARFYTTSPFYFTGRDRARVEAVAEAAGTTRLGGDCYSYGLLARGLIDLVIESDLRPYDYFAVVPIVEEAGGIMTDWRGRPLSMASDGRVVAAATPALHEAALAMLGR